MGHGDDAVVELTPRPPLLPEVDSFGVQLYNLWMGRTGMMPTGRAVFTRWTLIHRSDTLKARPSQATILAVG